jgi:hypothetical protein
MQVALFQAGRLDSVERTACRTDGRASATDKMEGCETLTSQRFMGP